MRYLLAVFLVGCGPATLPPDTEFQLDPAFDATWREEILVGFELWATHTNGVTSFSLTDEPREWRVVPMPDDAGCVCIGRAGRRRHVLELEIDGPYRKRGHHTKPLVVAHELGHLLGLGHVANPDDVMSTNAGEDVASAAGRWMNGDW